MKNKVEVVCIVGKYVPPHIIVATKDGRSYCLKGDVMDGITMLETCFIIDLAPCQVDIEFNADIKYHH